jgi:hypothetical protein
MTIKQQGGIFGRNPTFNNVTVDGILTVDQIAEKTGAAGITLDGVTLKDGNVVLADGKGIDFSATAGTGTSELFNDYEEGTWTPTVFDAVSGGNQGTIGNVTGFYTKTGNMVTVNCSLVTITTTGMTAGNIFYIGGLPFTAKSGTNSISYHGVTDSRNVTTTSGGVIASWIVNNQSRARLFTTTTAGVLTSVLVSNVTSGSGSIFLSLTYMTA